MRWFTRAAIPIAACAGIAFAPVASQAVSASASSAPPLRHVKILTRGRECSDRGLTNSCIDVGSSGDGAKIRTQAAGYRSDFQRIDVVVAKGVCPNNRVSNRLVCPFPGGSGLNTVFNHWRIVNLQFAGLSDRYIGLDASDTFLLSVPRSGHGTLFVRFHSMFVNLTATDHRDIGPIPFFLHNKGWNEHHANGFVADVSLLQGANSMWGAR